MPAGIRPASVPLGQAPLHTHRSPLGNPSRSHHLPPGAMHFPLLAFLAFLAIIMTAAVGQKGCQADQVCCRGQAAGQSMAHCGAPLPRSVGGHLLPACDVFVASETKGDACELPCEDTNAICCYTKQ